MKNNNISHFVKVHDYNTLIEGTRKFAGKDQKYTVYWCLMDKLNDLSVDESKMMYTLLSHEFNNKVKNFTLEEASKILDDLSKGLEFEKDKVLEFYHSYMTGKIIQTDLHSGNIMKDNGGNFKLIDLDRLTIKEYLI